MAQAVVRNKAINLWTSRILPLLLIGLVTYVSWVVIAQLCVNYLLNTPAGLAPRRRGAGIAICVVYSILLLMMGLTYFRILYVIILNPGYVPQGAMRESKSKLANRQEERERIADIPRDIEEGANSQVEKSVNGLSARDFDPSGAFRPSITTERRPGLELFYNKNVFSCQGDGAPIWCTTCKNWKPDRAHHCSEIDRCVKKMDHFCPWVGGVVSETSFKFFIQFVAWTTIYCIFTLIVMAYFVAEHNKKPHIPTPHHEALRMRLIKNYEATPGMSVPRKFYPKKLIAMLDLTSNGNQADHHMLQTHSINGHWLATLILAALFGVFTVGMAGSSLQFAILNTTTIENLSRKTKVWTLAVYMPKPPDPSFAYRTKSYYKLSKLSNPPTQNEPAKPNAMRTFAILHTRPGENPFDLGPFRNFKSVMGDHWYDWFFPIKYSPCCDHDRQEAQYAMGPVVQRLRNEAGITPPTHADDEKASKKRRHRRHRRRRSTHHGAEHRRSEKINALNEVHYFPTGHDRDDIDLESGLAHTDGSAH